ncbi:iron-sulfur cluster assembly protein [Solimonas aquatica]|uniref:Iron-sulfur cluster assembly protein n=1 Tax=Solimonas aquatica TaxID=489703 RepID=A0A1H9IRC1_9GAMM|nr:iron-sulfur cluster assembly accessory protein [Solimonas aquatica]SEQ77059.1 iron-sulfur cluster assembly protein [Solimonas aquatica]
MAVLVTEAAARQIRRTIEKRGKGVGLRLAVKASGCSGLSYVMAVADEIGAEDQCFDSAGVKLVVDARSLPLLDGIEIDFVREGLNEGFKFLNPNAKGTCGCGSSFAV